jgi:YHS domain-containing protein
VIKIAVSPDRILRTRDDCTMHDIRPIDPNEDPVCGMRVDIEAARAKGLIHTHEGREYVFCGKGCFLDFKDDPAPFLDPKHQPSM